MFSAKTSWDDLRPHKCQDLCSETLNRGVTCNTNVKLSGDNKLSVAAAFSHSAVRSSCLCFSHSWRTPPTRRPHLPLARLFMRKSCVAQRRPILPVGEHPPLSLLGYSENNKRSQGWRLEGKRLMTLVAPEIHRTRLLQNSLQLFIPDVPSITSVLGTF